MNIAHVNVSKKIKVWFDQKTASWSKECVKNRDICTKEVIVSNGFSAMLHHTYTNTLKKKSHLRSISVFWPNDFPRDIESFSLCLSNHSAPSFNWMSPTLCRCIIRSVLLCISRHRAQRIVHFEPNIVSMRLGIVSSFKLHTHKIAHTTSKVFHSLSDSNYRSSILSTFHRNRKEKSGGHNVNT